LDRCIEVINSVGKEMTQDDIFGPMILTPPKVLRVDDFGESALEVKILGDTRPLKQWDVMGELRKRIKKAFDKEGIEIPWPHAHVKVLFEERKGKSSLVCQKCLHPNLQGSKFCANCGAPLTS